MAEADELDDAGGRRPRTDARRHRPRARRLRRRGRGQGDQRRSPCQPSCWSTARSTCSATTMTTTTPPPTWRRARCGRWRGSASPIPMQGDALMATRNDDDEGGIAAVARHARPALRRGHEATLRDQIEEAIDEAEGGAPKRGDLTPARAADAAQPAPFRRPHRRRHRGHARRHRRGAGDDQLRGPGRRLRRGRAQPPAGLPATASTRSSA